MKKFFGIVFGVFALAMSAGAEEVKCGTTVSIPSEYTVGLRDASCIGLDLDAGVAVIAGNDASAGLVTKAIRLSRRGKAVEVLSTLTRGETEENTTPYYAFESNCGLSLITARIVDDTEVLLIFDNLTVVRWNWANPYPRVVALATRYDPKTVYLCYGIRSGIDTYAEFIDFDFSSRRLTVRNRYENDSVSVRF